MTEEGAKHDGVLAIRMTVESANTTATHDPGKCKGAALRAAQRAYGAAPAPEGNTLDTPKGTPKTRGYP